MHRLYSTECYSCELEIIARKQVSLIFKALFQHLDGQTKENQRNRSEYKKFVLKIELGPVTIPTGRESTNHSTKNLRHKHQISLKHASFICNITISVNQSLYL